MMKIYLAGPMRGIKDFNFPAFYKAAYILRDMGCEVFSPAERDTREHGHSFFASETGNLSDISDKGFSLREALAKDLNWICKHADAVALLPEWEQSKGARAERATAEALGLEIIEL